MIRPAYIVAVGARCPVGLTAESAAAAIRAGISRVAEHPFLTDPTGEKLLCAKEPTVDPTLLGTPRLVLMAVSCLREVTAKLDRSSPAAHRLPVVLGLPEPRPGFREQDAISVQHGLRANNIPGVGTISTSGVGSGHASALSALHEAVERVTSDTEEICIAGGVDSYLSRGTVGWLDADRRLARAQVRGGFAPGEGAAMVAVANARAIRRYGLTPLAQVRAVGRSHEARGAHSDEGVLGEGLTEAVLSATAGLHWPRELISDTYGDVNGERWRAEDWGFTLLRTAQRFRDGTTYVTPVGQCGDIGAATGALGCVLAVQAWLRRCANGRHALIWAGSWGGLRAAVLLTAEA